MNDIKFYNIEPSSVGNISTFTVDENDNGDFAFSCDVKKLQHKVKELESKNHINEIIEKSIINYLNQNGDELLFSQRKALNDYLDSL